MRLKASQGRGSWFYVNPLFGVITWPFLKMDCSLLWSSKSPLLFEIRQFLSRFSLDNALVDDFMRYRRHAEVTGQNRNDLCMRLISTRISETRISGNGNRLKQEMLPLYRGRCSVAWETYALRWFGTGARR
jgi:hypothetical protein